LSGEVHHLQHLRPPRAAIFTELQTLAKENAEAEVLVARLARAPLDETLRPGTSVTALICQLQQIDAGINACRVLRAHDLATRGVSRPGLIPLVRTARRVRRILAGKARAILTALEHDSRLLRGYFAQTDTNLH